MRLSSVRFLKSVTSLVTLFLLTMLFANCGPGSPSADDQLHAEGFGGKDTTRPLTIDEYRAIKRLLEDGEWNDFNEYTSDTGAGWVRVDGVQWNIYRNSLCKDRSRRIHAKGVEFTDPHGQFTNFDQLIAWSKDR